MKRRGIKNLIVDLGGVLVDLDLKRFYKSFEDLGLENAEQVLNIGNQPEFLKRYEKGEISTAEFRDIIREKIGKPLTDEQIDKAWTSMLVGIPTDRLDLLLRLRKDYVVYLLSNTNELHWNWVCENAFKYKGFDENDYFEREFLSFQMNMIKPDLEIFRKVIEEEGLEVEQTVFIDDSVLNCKAANTIGIQTYTPQAGENWGENLSF